MALFLGEVMRLGRRTQSRLRTSSPWHLWLLNLLIVVLLLVVGYFSYALVQRSILHFPAQPVSPVTSLGNPIQLDVLNGCGVPGVASKFTSHLRAHGFDVVEMKNFTSFDVRETLVIDRAGNLDVAHTVAQALGVREENVIQQINPHYFVDVTVIVGKDFPLLKPTQ